MPDLTTIERTLQTLFTTEADHLARHTGLVQRESKLTGPLIVLILVAGFIQHPDSQLQYSGPSRRRSPGPRYPPSRSGAPDVSGGHLLPGALPA
ncbi:MAG: hypothetical protein M3Z04_10110 [Chloroflexota bacterium]|nr:hypothetical protein [Chloroflexota bacterium]